jgi:hypothetical protein
MSIKLNREYGIDKKEVQICCLIMNIPDIKGGLPEYMAAENLR